MHDSDHSASSDQAGDGAPACGLSRRTLLGLGAAAVVAPGLAGLPAAQAAPSSTPAAGSPTPAAGPTTTIDVDAARIARTNVNGLTFKGFGVLSANSTSALLMDYKALHPHEYDQLLRILFGGRHPIMTMVKIEMGNDRNTSTGPEPSTMRTATEAANVAREPGFQLAADARRYNPRLQVSILRWRSPAWADTDDKVYVWYKNTILAAYRRYGYMVGSVNPGFNETTPDLAWTRRFAELVHTDTTGYVSDDSSLAGFRTGEAALFHTIKVIISDESGLGSFGDDMIADESLREAIDVAGYHYTTDDTKAHDFTHLAEQYDKEVWNSEAQATFSNSAFRPHNNTADPTVPGTGIGGNGSALEMANTVVKGFVNSRRTHFIYQPAIGSFYEGGQYSFKELVSARDPWSGWIHYDVGLAVLQHFSSFAVTGWENGENTAGVWRFIPSACASTAAGTNPVDGRNGLPNYVTMAAPDGSDFSTVIVNDSERTLTYSLSPTGFTGRRASRLEVWQTRAAEAGERFNARYKRHIATLRPGGSGAFLVSVAPYSITTLTTLDVRHDSGWTTPLPAEGERTVLVSDAHRGVLWSDDFDYDSRRVPVIGARGGLSGRTESFVASRGGAAGAVPLLSWDRNGGFEALRDADRRHVLRQQLDHETTGVGTAWNGGDPITGIGDLRWTNYTATVHVHLLRGVADDNYAAIGARSTGGGSSNQLSGTPYALRLGSDGTWQFLRLGTRTAIGTVSGFDAGAWHRIAITVAGPTISGAVDGTQVFAWTDPKPYLSGRVDLACGFHLTDFARLRVEQVDDQLPFYSELLDNLEMTDLAVVPRQRLRYSGSWKHENGQGMYVYQRSTSTSQGAGASISYTFTGSGLDIIGKNDGSAKLNVSVDGSVISRSAASWPSGEFQQTYSLRGLPYGRHTVTLLVTAGTLIVDAVGVAGVRARGHVSPAELSKALAAAAKASTGSLDAASRRLLQANIAQAREAVRNPVRYGLDTEGARQLIARLEAATK